IIGARGTVTSQARAPLPMATQPWTTLSVPARRWRRQDCEHSGVHERGGASRPSLWCGRRRLGGGARDRRSEDVWTGHEIRDQSPQKKSPSGVLAPQGGERQEKTGASKGNASRHFSAGIAGVNAEGSGPAR